VNSVLNPQPCSLVPGDSFVLDDSSNSGFIRYGLGTETCCEYPYGKNQSSFHSFFI
jgi:hypothetical protein